LLTWRGEWAERANEHLLRAGHEVRIDHRTLEAQGIELVPGRKLGLSAERQRSATLTENLARRVAEQRAIAAENGQRVLADPQIALKALTHHQATFTELDIAKWLHGRTDGAEQFQAVYLKVTTSPELVALGVDAAGKTRYTTQEMLGVERALLARAEQLEQDRGHGVSARHRDQVLAEGVGSRLSAEQRAALEHVTGEAGLAVVVGVAGAGKSTMLSSARQAWEAQGFTVKGAALSGIAAENLELASGIPGRTLASWEYAWAQGRELLGQRDVLVIDEAGLIGTRQLAGVLERAQSAGAKVVLVGDPEQLQAIEAGAAFRGIAAQAGTRELRQVRRQREGWQQEATRELATGRTTDALAAYERAGRLWGEATRDGAREALLAAWQKGGKVRPGESRLMLAYTRDDVLSLNTRARELRTAAAELGAGEIIQTERGAREFAGGDRLYFLKNDRGLGVKNGSLGTVEKISHGVLQVRLDGTEQRRVAVDSAQYAHLEHGYAATVYKAQGVTVDRTYVLATPHWDRHSTYVALSRHRETTALFYGREDFQPAWSRAAPEENLKSVLSRARPKELAHDYLERGGAGGEGAVRTREQTLGQASAAEREQLVTGWKQEAVAAWRAFRETQRAAEQKQARERERVRERELERSRERELERGRERGRSRGRDYDIER
ncbi:MAG TPA: Ti-type conjugative transfer relaxase TraA, partial [Solirubrobacteraceae bacterium]|nr:Ti-type conjugative transfer relaxase TraA [Solirubrobacteraceae bacterium]